MRPTKTQTLTAPRHLRDLEQTLFIDLEPHNDEKQPQTGTLPKDAKELGHKGRSWTGR